MTRTARIRHRLVAAVLLVFGLARLVAAQPAAPSEDELAVARRLFQQATLLEKGEQWAQAAAKLEQAISIKETPGLRYHLAYCEEQQGNLVQALADYERAEELIRLGTRAPDVEALLSNALSSLQKRIPDLRIIVPQSVENPWLTIGGKEVAAAVLSDTIPLNPGSHSLRIGATGYRPYETSIVLEEGQHKTLRAELRPLPPEQPAVPNQPAESTAPVPFADESQSGAGPWRTAIIVTTATLTAGALSAGIVGLVQYSAANDRAEAAQRDIDDEAQRLDVSPEGACSTPAGTLTNHCGALDVANQDARNAKKLATIGFVAAGAGALLTTMTALLWKPPPDKPIAYGMMLDDEGVTLTVTGVF